MSGGVDSAVAAALLRGRGLRRARAVHAQLGRGRRRLLHRRRRPPGRAQASATNSAFRCTPSASRPSTASACSRHFLDELRAGRTPNPDVPATARSSSASASSTRGASAPTAFATGHYARSSPRTVRRGCCAARTPTRTRRYFLHTVPGDVARTHACFRSATCAKAEVRRIARERGAAGARQARQHRHLLHRRAAVRASSSRSYLPAQPGPDRDDRWARLGAHRGLMYYTLGQRQGLDLGGVRGARGSPVVRRRQGPWHATCWSSAQGPTIPG